MDDMARIGYRWSRADLLVRILMHKGLDSSTTITSTYTDDTSGMSSSKAEAALAIAKLGKKYSIKDLSNIKFVLGICILHDHQQHLLTMDQKEYLK
ncbi:hypothetical protein DXG03_003382 [Asterophora parasitica]|uniref:Uncharacterized protein n=1 Tax=Asterophora parasitica TaxID=117018 RepID=A0A9P7K8C5_9AGAR|nr:hypothetical protein DXG03_003382 [Asterophora parasitica]